MIYSIPRLVRKNTTDSKLAFNKLIIPLVFICNLKITTQIVLIMPNKIVHCGNRYVISVITRKES